MNLWRCSLIPRKPDAAAGLQVWIRAPAPLGMVGGLELLLAGHGATGSDRAGVIVLGVLFAELDRGSQSERN